MFDNIGGKIKGLAQIGTQVGIVVSAILGIIIIVWGYDVGYDEVTFVIGIGVIVLGALFSWLGSFYIYGFGELIDCTAEIAEKLNTPTSTPDGKAAPKTNLTDVLAKIPTVSHWYCSECGTKNNNNRTVCWQCGKQK